MKIPLREYERRTISIGFGRLISLNTEWIIISRGMTLPIDDIIETIASNREYKSKLRKALEIDDDYAMKSDLIPILERLEEQGTEIRRLTDEMVAQRDEMHTGFEKMWEELAKQREEMHTGFEKMWEELAKQREEMHTGFEKIWEELAKQREEMHTGFEKVWEEMKELRLDVNKVHRRMDKHERWLKKIGGDDLELMSKLWLTGVLEAKQLPHENLIWKKKLRDEKERLGTADIEIDIFSDDPLLVVEVSSYFSDLDKLTRFLKKLEFVEEKYGKKATAAIITYGFEESISDIAIEIIESKGINLIMIGRKFEWEE